MPADGKLFRRMRALEAEIDTARTTLAHTDIGSLPNDWTLQRVAEARIDDLIKLRDQAEKAEAAGFAAGIEAAAEVLEDHKGRAVADGVNNVAYEIGFCLNALRNLKPEPSHD